MRIVLWQQSDVWGAAEAYLARVAQGAVDAGHEVHLVAPSSSHAMWRSAIAGVVHVADLPGSVGGAVRLVRRIRPEVLHVNDAALPALVAGRLLGVRRTVLTFHTPAQPLGWNHRASALWRLAAGNPALRVILLSATNQRTFLDRFGGPPGRTVVIAPGIEDLGPRGGGPSTTDPVALVTVARLEPQKALHQLIGAVSLVSAELGADRVRLDIVGDGTLRVELEAQVASLGLSEVVRFTGWLDDPMEVVRTADVYCSSSLYEGLPFAVLEAMSLGLPVIAPAIDGLLDAIDDTVGALVPPGDVAALSREIVAAIRHPADRQRQSAAARARFLERFTVARMVRETLEVYES